MTERVAMVVSMEIPEGETEQRCVEYVGECIKANRTDWDGWEHFKDFYQLKVWVRCERL